MRFKKLLLGDIRFQFKYGFYYLYAIITLIYVVILELIPELWREKAGGILIFTDPATLGMMFMGAIILLEKSQGVLNSLAVSPLKVSEYILSKVISLGILSTLVGTIIALFVGVTHLPMVILGTFLGAVLFSLLGMAVGTKINSLNGFILGIVPLQILIIVPGFLALFGIGRPYLWWHPGVIILNWMGSNSIQLGSHLLGLLLWILAAYVLAYKTTSKMMGQIGGVKL